ncbi:PREDICTED: chromogranin-A [Dipodomys ordii]|uniref:Chromogranin-A n=1 Tax=Dipodomys ordii TaxID=10020 RepID=A0A1S3F038_DIPOR|nr:PREDICTED: chromogranin-A [Dipodomys ordii]
MNKGDAKVMRCIVEVISDSLSKPSPKPVSHECLETLQGDERILSILRHQNLLKELQDLALQGAKERAQQQKRPSSFEEELSQVLQGPSNAAGVQAVTVTTTEAAPGDAEQTREDAAEPKPGGATQEAEPPASPEPGQESQAAEDSQGPSPRAPASLPAGSREDPSQGPGEGERALSPEQRPQAEAPHREEEEEEGAEAEEKAAAEDEDPTAAFDSHPSLGSKNIQKGGQDALATDGAGKPGAEQARGPTGQGEQRVMEDEEEEEEMAGAPRGLFQGGQSGPRLPGEWEDAKRWSRMDQLAKELRADQRPERPAEDDDPDRSMRLSFRARAPGFPGPQLRRGWRPPSRDDSGEEKKEEEGSANRRAEDQELESLSAIEAELEKVAHQLQALRQG